MNLPIYDIVLSEEGDRMLCNSIVENPANDSYFIAFEKQNQDNQPKLLKFENDGLEHKVFGCLIRADYPIYRIDNFGQEYFVRFSKETIQNIILKYSKEGLHNLCSIQHNGVNLDGITLTEFFIKDTSKGINPIGFEDIEEGSLFGVYKIENTEVWDMIQSNELQGFSIEINCTIEPTNETIDFSKETQEPDYNDLDTMINELVKYLNGEIVDIDFVFADSKKKINELIENAIDNDTKVNIGVKGTNKTINGYIYTTNDNIVSLYDMNKDTWHIIQKNTITNIKLINSNVVVDWGKAMANPDFQRILDIVRENPNPQPKATVGNDIIEDAIINKKVVMVKYDDETEFNCKTFRQGYILTKIINRKGNLCLRFFENSGATHSAEENPLPSWRTLRIDRLVEIKFAPTIFAPLTIAPKGWNPTLTTERDGSVVLLKSKFE